MSDTGDTQNPSPTIKEDAEAISAQLGQYAAKSGGTCKVVANQAHMWEELYPTAGLDMKPKILIMCTGETARGEYAGGDRTDLHRVDRNWQVVVMRGHGFKNLMSESQGQDGTPGAVQDFYDVLETVRDGIRVMSNISEEFPVNYKGIRPLPNVGPTPSSNVFLDCSVIEFDTAADIPRILDGTTG